MRGICPALCSAGWFVDTADVFFPALTFARRCCALRAKQMMRRCFAKRGSTLNTNDVSIAMEAVQKKGPKTKKQRTKLGIQD